MAAEALSHWVIVLHLRALTTRRETVMSGTSKQREESLLALRPMWRMIGFLCGRLMESRSCSAQIAVAEPH